MHQVQEAFKTVSVAYQNVKVCILSRASGYLIDGPNKLLSRLIKLDKTKLPSSYFNANGVNYVIEHVFDLWGY